MYPIVWQEGHTATIFQNITITNHTKHMVINYNYHMDIDCLIMTIYTLFLYVTTYFLFSKWSSNILKIIVHVLLWSMMTKVLKDCQSKSEALTFGCIDTCNSLLQFMNGFENGCDLNARHQLSHLCFIEIKARDHFTPSNYTIF